MRKLLASLGFAFLAGCGGNLDDRVDASVNSLTQGAVEKKCAVALPSIHHLFDAYDLIKPVILARGLKTRSVNRIYNMAESQMERAKMAYVECGSCAGYDIATIYVTSALNLLTEVGEQQDEPGYGIAEIIDSRNLE